MLKKTSKNQSLKLKRKARSNVKGSAERPRLCLSRSAKHVYAQVIDDTVGSTLVSVSSMEESLRGSRAGVDVCKKLGNELAQRCLAKDIKKVAFDKCGNRYHGRVTAFADSAREAGLSF